VIKSCETPRGFLVDLIMYQPCSIPRYMYLVTCSGRKKNQMTFAWMVNPPSDSLVPFPTNIAKIEDNPGLEGLRTVTKIGTPCANRTTFQTMSICHF
jgi:hypothetical protein